MRNLLAFIAALATGSFASGQAAVTRGGAGGLTVQQASLIFTTPLFVTSASPSVNDGAALGTTALGWADLHGATGFTLNIANGNWLATHTSGILTVGVGDLRINSAGTNAASVVTVNGTQTLANKTLTTPDIGAATGTSLVLSGPASAASFTATGSDAGRLNLPEGPATALIANTFSIYAPTDVAAGGLAYVTPAAAATGLMLATNSSGVMTITHSAVGTGVATALAVNTGSAGAFAVRGNAESFSTVDTGQGANELYDMNQNVQTTDAPTFSNVAITTSTLTYSTTPAVDFSGDGFKIISLTGDATFSGSNYAAGKSVTVIIIGDGSIRNLAFDADWIFVGAAAPATLAANKKAVLTLTSTTGADTGIVAAYSAQP